MTRSGISVAMCTFNGGRFVSAQLESIAAQSRPPDEFVICDDGSADGTVDIVRAFAVRASFPVRIEVNEQNLGSTKNFEKAISLCGGAIVALADQDDVWYPHKLERLGNALLTSEPVVAAFSDADLIDDDSRPLRLRLWKTFGFDSAKQKDFAAGRSLDVLLKRAVVTGATLAFRKECFDHMLPIPPKQIHDTWISFLLAAAGRLAVIPAPLMQYRLHGNQQIGAGAYHRSLSEQTAKARARGSQFRLEQIERLRELYAALETRETSFPCADDAKQAIAAKINHLARRADLPRPKTARFYGILHETLNGGYWRYSSGWKSIARDIFLS